MSKQLQIRNSTAEFLIFQAEDKAQGVQVFYKDESIWATQEVIATLFDKGRPTITEHLRNIFASGELDQNSVCRKQMVKIMTRYSTILMPSSLSVTASIPVALPSSANIISDWKVQ